MTEHKLGTIEAANTLITELYIELRRRVNQWASITHQTAQARMGYVGQHLVSVVTGFQGGRSGARGKDLLLGKDKFAEIKTCYRVDQLGKCNSCGAVIASIEDACPECGSSDVKRNDDSKWLIGIRNDEEFSTILDPVYYYLVLFDFTDLAKPHTIRASVYRVDSLAPGFAYCMVDYYLNIRAKSKSKAPYNLWPFQLKFALMRPLLIYRSLISSDDSITTETFPGRDNPVAYPFPPMSDYGRATNLTTSCLQDIARRFGVLSKGSSPARSELLTLIEQKIRPHMPADLFIDALAHAMYMPVIKKHIPSLPSHLKEKIKAIIEHIENTR